MNGLNININNGCTQYICKQWMNTITMRTMVELTQSI